VRSSCRVRDFVSSLVNGGLGLNEVLIWYDWAQGVSLPQSHLETNTMFYGNARHQLGLFGCVIMQRLASGVIRTKNIVIITDILDHTCQFATVLLERCQKELHDPS